MVYGMNSLHFVYAYLSTAACAPECSTGLKQCFGPTASDCCLVVLNGMCASQCANANMLPDEDNFCICINFYDGDLCTGRQYACM